MSTLKIISRDGGSFRFALAGLNAREGEVRNQESVIKFLKRVLSYGLVAKILEWNLESVMFFLRLRGLSTFVVVEVCTYGSL